MRAFTLLETLVYVALFSFLVTGTFSAITSFEAAAKRGVERLNLLVTVDADLERASLLARNADAVVTPAIGATSSVLLISSHSRTEQVQIEGAVFVRDDTVDDPDHIRLTITRTWHAGGTPMTVSLSQLIYLPS